ncbi:flagellar basal body rod C-terminal domain-containing protein [Buchnera aphidicola (Ceratovacuna keduensis)]|uniref:flagellar basal body rod C-terminal domain-containing protein n=1 Tax=Buchnera aphidicola TaxID=9 RepID=UPI0031B82A65
MENKICSYINLANRILEKQEIINNNLSNLSTIGFKAKFNYFLKVYNEKNKNIKNKTINYYDNSIGQLNHTNQPLDSYLINKNGWFLVKDKNSKIYLTRNGNIKINKKNALSINNNFLIGINNEPIYIPKNFFPKIKNDGTIIISYKKNFINKDKIIGKIKFKEININKLKEYNNGLFKIKKKCYKKYLKNKNLEIRTGILEGSNVNPISNIIENTSNARTFEIIMKIISTKNENEKKINQILNINN